MTFSLDDYNYELPDELVRKVPLEKRDESRLFVYNTSSGEMHFDTFKNVANYLPKESIIVRNVTKVLPVRLRLHKETGGKIEVFLLMNEYKGTLTIPAIVDRKLIPGMRVMVNDDVYFTVDSQDEGTFYLRPSFDLSEIEEILEKYGTTPVPHYLDDVSHTEDKLRARYQSLFAKRGASTAAPTASLHFTDEVFESLKEKKVGFVDVLLNVGLGTFANIDETNIQEKKLHKEYFEVSDESARALYTAKQYSKPVIAVGTTAMRTLESWKHTEEYIEEKGAQGDTQIFIYPPYSSFFADGLITNFHLPKTSLMLLVEAFLQSKNAKHSVTELYKIAIDEKFSFYSFGDAMLIM